MKTSTNTRAKADLAAKGEDLLRGHQGAGSVPVDYEVEWPVLLKTSMDMITDYLATNPEGVSAARQMGHQFGVDTARTIEWPSGRVSPDQAVAELSRYWAKNKIGSVGWGKRPLLTVRRAPAPAVKQKGVRLCAFVEGMVEAFVNFQSDRSCRVSETRCGLSSGHSCSFRVSTEAAGPGTSGDSASPT